MQTIMRSAHIVLALVFAFILVSEAQGQSSKVGSETAIGGESMYYIVETDKSFDRAVTDLDAAVKRHGFSVLYIHDLGETFRGKGIAFDEQVKVFEICNAKQAARVLSTDMRLNMALPCRISVYTDQGKTSAHAFGPVSRTCLSSSCQRS